MIKLHSKTNSTDLPPINQFEAKTVEKLLRNLNARKGAGPDGIIPRVIKLCATQLSTIVTQLYNTSIELSTVPTMWKTAIIKPLPKVPTPTQPKEYRPIAMTSCLSKILEKLVKHYICQHTTLDPLQFAYRQGRSTQDAVLQLVTTITDCIDAKAGNISRCLFLDFSSAFNTINVEFLTQRLGHLDPKVSNWVASFLQSRVQYTKTNDALSKKLITNTGTPQGTVLSPLLFSIYTDSIRSQEFNVTILKYADDTVIIGNIAAHDDFSKYLSEISRITNLCKANDLLLNASKTNEVIFSTQKALPDVTHLTLDSTEIIPSESVKYLGVEIDNKLRFEDHIDAKVSKARQRLYLVKQFKFLGASDRFLNQIFSAFVESCFFYCLVVIFCNLYERDKKSVRKVYKAAYKIGLPNAGLDPILNDRLHSYIRSIQADSDHPFHDYIHKLKSGRLRAYKHRTAVGKNSFIRQFINFINQR